MSNFKSRIKELRVKYKYTQQELGEKVKVTSTAVSYWESGKAIPNYETLEKLSKIFNVSIDYLTGNELIKNKDKESLLRQIDKVNYNQQKLLMNILSKIVQAFIEIGEENGKSNS